ncbi:ankyrin repeat-containing domain protein [Choanephora cucurbitarum]|nr:ankyrin repeat-containing domain protein [Choanephora cucurbitarum]
MMIPPLCLEKYHVTTAQQRQNLPTPPTSPDEVVTPIKRKQTADHSPSKRTRLDLTLLHRYLSSGKPVHVKDAHYGLNLLCWACQCQSVEAVDSILNQGRIDINQRHGARQMTALHMAALTNFHQGLQRLVDHPDLDINQRDTQGLTAVHYAARQNCAEALEVLIESGARIDVYDRQGRLPLHYAIMHGSQAVLKLLLTNQERNNPTGLNLIWSSPSSLEEAVVITGNPDIIQVLIEQGAFVSIRQGGWWEACYGVQYSRMLEQCVYWNRLSCLISLLRYKDRLPSLSALSSVLHLAVQQRKLDIVQYLVKEHQADPCHQDGSNPSLLYAVNHGFMEMIPFLLTSSTSSHCIQRACLLAHMIGQTQAWSRLVKIHWQQ